MNAVARLREADSLEFQIISELLGRDEILLYWAERLPTKPGYPQAPGAETVSIGVTTRRFLLLTAGASGPTFEAFDLSQVLLVNENVCMMKLDRKFDVVQRSTEIYVEDHDPVVVAATVESGRTRDLRVLGQVASRGPTGWRHIS